MNKAEYYKKNKVKIDLRNKKWRKNNREKYLEIMRLNVKKWRKNFKKRDLEGYKKRKKLLQEKYYFGKTRREIFGILGEICCLCGKKEKLDIHHIDGKGTRFIRVKDKNNNINNLCVLCRKCHIKEEFKRIKKERGTGWSLKYKYCVICKKTESKHAAFGICNKCYQQTRRKYKRDYWRKNYAKKVIHKQGLDK